MPSSDALVLMESINQTGITICTRLDSILFFMLLKLDIAIIVSVLMLAHENHENHENHESIQV